MEEVGHDENVTNLDLTSKGARPLPQGQVVEEDVTTIKFAS